MIFRTLEADGLLENTALFRFLLGLRPGNQMPGLLTLQTSDFAKIQRPANAPSWVTTRVWQQLKRLETYEPFNREITTHHLLKHASVWEAFQSRDEA